MAIKRGLGDPAASLQDLGGTPRLHGRRKVSWSDFVSYRRDRQHDPNGFDIRICLSCDKSGGPPFQPSDGKVPHGFYWETSPTLPYNPTLADIVDISRRFDWVRAGRQLCGKSS